MAKRNFNVVIRVEVDVPEYMAEYNLAFVEKGEVEEDIRNMFKSSLDNDLEIFSDFLKYEVEGV